MICGYVDESEGIMVHTRCDIRKGYGDFAQTRSNPLMTSVSKPPLGVPRKTLEAITVLESFTLTMVSIMIDDLGFIKSN